MGLTSMMRSFASSVFDWVPFPDGFPAFDDHTFMVVSFLSSDTPTEMIHPPLLAWWTLNA